MDGQADILIIGGGMAGLCAATVLAQAGADVIVLDKGRGPGGRMATRRVAIGGEQVGFDHGAQYFTARDPGFREVVAGWEAAGVAARWPAAGDDAWVGTPGMNAPIPRHGPRVSTCAGMCAPSGFAATARSGGWEAGEELFHADTVLVAVPAEQAAVLLAEPAPAMAARAAGIASAPCWAVMAGFAAPLPLADTFRSESGPVSWAARNSAKPGRSGVETWVIHASPARSGELIDLPREEVAKILLADFFASTGAPPATPLLLDAHRWLYAQPEARQGEGPHYDPELRIGIAGDWLHSPRIEGAWLSGRALAASLR